MSDQVSASVRDRMDLSGRVFVVTGAGGLLGRQHAEAIAEMGGIPVLADIRRDAVEKSAREVADRWHVEVLPVAVDITSKEAVEDAAARVYARFGRVDGLVNNAANNPKVEAAGAGPSWSRFETFSPEIWAADIAVGLTGALFCSQAFGRLMAQAGRGVILNIASDLAVIAPDQRIYHKPGLAEEAQPVKPVSYSVVKFGLVGLTKYLATYWAERGIRVNALSPGGVRADQDEAFVDRLTSLIPLGRMAREHEYRSIVAFLLSDAAAYMTGQNIVVDGGRSVW
jgi:NAD(P)-dependent dehydrogenase (short-subunit alcohol dehydrogenase family)